MITQLLAILVLLLLLAGWIAVQRAWQNTFSPEGSQGDALAARSGCQGCNCGMSECQRQEDPFPTDPGYPATRNDRPAIKKEPAHHATR